MQVHDEASKESSHEGSSRSKDRNEGKKHDYDDGNQADGANDINQSEMIHSRLIEDLLSDEQTEVYENSH